MNDIISHEHGLAQPAQGLITLTHVVYGLHAFSALTGLASAAFIVTAFLSGWPSILAVILNYVKRGDVRGTFLASHFRWQIRTFWFALLWFVLLGVLAFLLVVVPAITVIGLPLAIGFGTLLFGVAMLVGLWVLYRIARGWLALTSNASMPA